LRRRSVLRRPSGAGCSKWNQDLGPEVIITGIAYVLSGICEVRWGERGESVARAKAGDFIHVPAFLPHMEINPSNQDSFRWVVVRSTATPIVVNLPDNTWP
jgi:uncharacterized RmlC-like cupin family protein